MYEGERRRGDGWMIWKGNRCQLARYSAGIIPAGLPAGAAQATCRIEQYTIKQVVYCPVV